MTTNELYQLKIDCTGCFACYSICPTDAISMVSDYEGFLYPNIDEIKCINCRKCIKVCQIHHRCKNENISHVDFFSVKNKNYDVRKNSSSGGVFSLFAEYVLCNKGFIFGSIIDDEYKIIHVMGDTNKEYLKMRQSKYVQSEIKNTYRQCEEKLKEGSLVLFSGTPCQIEGLNNYLNKSYENLITLDFICHGVNSPLMYSEWLKTIPKTVDKSSLNFRDKTFGWQNFCISFKKNGKSYITKKTSHFLTLFWLNVILRPACYSCKFTNVNRVSDITMGDFWGIDDFFPEMNDGLGVSCILCNTEKGFVLFNKISKFCIFKACEFDKYIQYQPALYKCVDRPLWREKFWSDYNRYGFERTVKKYVGGDILSRGARFLRRIINKWM